MEKQTDRIGDYVSLDEAARMLGITRQSVDYAVKTGKLNVFRPHGRLLLLRSEVEAYKPAGYLNRRPSKSPRKTSAGGEEGTVTNGR
jgi:excisionase family DNA binding protein